MYYVRVNADGMVMLLENVTADRMSEYDMTVGFFVEALPTQELTQNVLPIMHGDKTTGTLWYTYKYLQTPEEKASEMEQRMTDLELAIAAMIGGAV